MPPSKTTSTGLRPKNTTSAKAKAPPKARPPAIAEFFAFRINRLKIFKNREWPFAILENLQPIDSEREELSDGRWPGLGRRFGLG